jgi:hypothetical protein
MNYLAFEKSSAHIKRTAQVQECPLDARAALAAGPALKSKRDSHSGGADFTGSVIGHVRSQAIQALRADRQYRLNYLLPCRQTLGSPT